MGFRSERAAAGLGPSGLTVRKPLLPWNTLRVCQNLGKLLWVAVNGLAEQTQRSGKTVRWPRHILHCCNHLVYQLGKKERKKWKKSIEIRLDQQQKSKSAYIKAATLFPSSSGLASLWLCRLNLNPACPDKVHSFLQVLTAAQKSHGQEKMTTDTINPTCTQSQARSTPWMTQYWLLHLKYQFLCRSLLGQNTACKCPG